MAEEEPFRLQYLKIGSDRFILQDAISQFVNTLTRAAAAIKLAANETAA